MTMHDHVDGTNPVPARPSRNAYIAWVFVGVIAVAAALFLNAHWGHVLGLLVWLPLLACPLMHFFMHGKHHHSSRRRSGDDPRP